MLAASVKTFPYSKRAGRRGMERRPLTDHLAGEAYIHEAQNNTTCGRAHFFHGARALFSHGARARFSDGANSRPLSPKSLEKRHPLRRWARRDRPVSPQLASIAPVPPHPLAVTRSSTTASAAVTLPPPVPRRNRATGSNRPQLWLPRRPPRSRPVDVGGRGGGLGEKHDYAIVYAPPRSARRAQTREWRMRSAASATSPNSTPSLPAQRRKPGVCSRCNNS